MKRFVPSLLALVSVLALGSFALAQSAPTTVATSTTIGNGGIGGALLGALLPALLAALGTAATAALGYLANLARGRAKLTRNERVSKALLLLSDLVFDKVSQIAQEAVLTLKAASSDGTLTADEAKAAAARAIQEVWQGLPADLKKLLAQVTGSEAAAIDTYVKPKIEAAVKVQNRNGAGLTVPRVVTPEMVNAARARLGLSPVQ